MTADPVIVAAYLAGLVACYWAGYQIGVASRFIDGMGKGL